MELQDALEFLPFCCDAEQYLGYGVDCAQLGQCYNAIRPMGGILWFSLPARLGISNDFLIIAHFLLVLISIALSFLVFKRITLLVNIRSFPKKYNFLLAVAMIFLSAIIHGVFFFPVLFVPLSDAPSGLLALIATWVFLLHAGSYGVKRIAMLFFSGLCFGLAAWVRVFFLYPLVLMVIFFVIYSLKKLKVADLVFCVALLPIIFQFYSTWMHAGSFSYIDPSESAKGKDAHFTNNAIGFDTVIMPLDAHRWYASCEYYLPLLYAVEARDWRSLSCLVVGRLNFYFGSYSSKTYIYNNSINFLHSSITDNMCNDDVGNERCWWLNNILKSSSDEMAPNNSHPVSRLNINADEMALVHQVLHVPGGHSYTFSIWLWGDVTEATLFVGRDKFHGDIASSKVKLTHHPVRYEMTFPIEDTDVYDIGIKVEHKNPSPISDVVGKSYFYAWGSKLERGEVVSDFQQAIQPDEIRTWSPLILSCNLLALMCAAIFAFKSARFFQVPGLMVVLFWLMMGGQSLLVVPEQRFVIYPMVMIWVYASMLFLVRFPSVQSRISSPLSR